MDPLAPVRELLARLDAMQRELDAVRAENAALRAENARLNARIAVLEDRLRANSSNSSKPPSSDGPAKPPPKGKSGKRRRGGQPGHPQHKRALLPADQVDHAHDVVPASCGHCAAPLSGSDPEPERHQQVDLPEKLRVVTEWRLHALTCPDCGWRTRATLAQHDALAFGPRLHGLLALLVGRFHLSHRDVPELLGELFAITMSDGAVTDCVQRVSDALAAPVDAAAEAARAQSVAHVDETGWRVGARRAWLWVMATTVATFFLVRRRRNQDVARELLGSFGGVVVSDRWSAYDYLDLLARQLCWAHLIREWQRFVDRGGPDAIVGEALQADTARLFGWWHRVRDGTLAREVMIARVTRLKGQMRRHLTDGTVLGSAKTAGTCQEVLDRFGALWTFVATVGVDPTNNGAERSIRPAVLWRKGSFGNDSERGATFAERILTVVATLRQHGRAILTFLIDALRARFQQTPVPSLIPAAT